MRVDDDVEVVEVGEIVGGSVEADVREVEDIEWERFGRSFRIAV